ncbi:unnamed protein product, partial [Symbiodinium sp. KB8]
MADSSSGPAAIPPERLQIPPGVEDVLCKWCRRSKFTTPHTTVCAGRALESDQVAKTLQDEAERSEYVRNLEEWERNKRDEDLQKWTGKAKTKTGGKCDSSLSAGRKQATRLEMLQGILWPEKVWQRVKGKQERPPKGLVTVPWQGTQIKGYLLDESYGRPVGTVAIYSEDVRYIGKEGDVLDSNSAIDDSEIDDTWEQMQLAARAPGIKVDESGSVQMKPPKGKSVANKEVLDELDDLWVNRWQISTLTTPKTGKALHLEDSEEQASESEITTSAAKKRKLSDKSIGEHKDMEIENRDEQENESSASTARPAGRSRLMETFNKVMQKDKEDKDMEVDKDQPEKPGPKPKKVKLTTKQLKSDSVQTSAAQLLQQVDDEAGVMTLSVTTFNNVLSKVKVCLQDENLATLVADSMDEDQQQAGLKIISDLRLAEQRLNACMDLVASMSSTEGDEFASDFLLAAAHAAEEAGVPVHKSVKDIAAVRETTALCAEHKWDEVIECLAKHRDLLESKSVVEIASRSVKVCFEEILRSLEARRVVGITVDSANIFRQPVTNLSGEDLHKELIGRLNVLVHFIDRLAGSSVGTSVGEDPRFQQMLNDVSPTKDLRNLLCDPGTTDDDIVTRAQTAGTALTSQGCMVQKCFCVYPAGARILDRMRALAGQYQKAKIQYNDLMRAHRAATSEDVATNTLVDWAHGSQIIKLRPLWGTIFGPFQQFQNFDDRWKRRAEREMAEISCVVDNTVSSLKAATSDLWTSLAPDFTAALKLLLSGGE